MARQKQSMAAVLKRTMELAGKTSNTDELSGMQQSILTEIESTYVTLWEDYSWPAKRISREVNLNKGQRFYDWPEDLDIDSFTAIWFDQGGNNWSDLTRSQGISPDMFSSYPPGAESDTIFAWDIYGDDQFEVFPTPGVQGSLIFRIDGYRTPLVLKDLQTLLDLDAEMVCLQAAANLTAKSDSRYSQTLQQRASTRIESMRMKGQSRRTIGFAPGQRGGPVSQSSRVVAIRSKF